MRSNTSRHFLALPQELRDLIYQHALRDTLPECEAFLEYGYENDTGGLIVNYPAQCPRTAWYTLLLCCKTTNKDIRELVQTTALKQKSHIPPAILDLRLSSTTSTAIWQSVPCHPRQISELHVNIRLSDIYESCFTSGAPNVDNAIIRALYHLLRRYCQLGPHLSRKALLSTQLSLDTVILHITPDLCVDEAQRFSADTDQQLATISGVFLIWLGRFARSGLLKHVDSLRWDCENIVETKGKIMEFKVTNLEWDMEDRYTFLHLGYSW